MRMLIRVLVAGLLVATPALGEDAASKSKPTAPKPSPALTQAFKDASGTWSCTGSMDNPQAPGTQVKTKSEMRISPAVDGFAYVGVFRMEKNAAMPAGGKGTLQWGYDASRNKLVELGFDNMGSTWQGTSDGEKDGVTVWTEEGTMMGQPVKTRTTVTKKSPKEFTLTTEVENKGAWQKLGEDTCKKK
jgi:hypothetical protein